MVSISYPMFGHDTDKTGCRRSVEKPLREDADRAYEVAVVLEGILCLVPQLWDPKIFPVWVAFKGMNLESRLDIVLGNQHVKIR